MRPSIGLASAPVERGGGICVPRNGALWCGWTVGLVAAVPFDVSDELTDARVGHVLSRRLFPRPSVAPFCDAR